MITGAVKPELYKDDKKRAVLESEPNLTLFPAAIMMKSKTEESVITLITVWDYRKDTVFIWSSGYSFGFVGNLLGDSSHSSISQYDR